jgi:predicted chitinase
MVVRMPGYSIAGAMQEKNYLQIVAEEQLLKLGFYLKGKAVMGVNYGDELQCRVQARNLVGKSVQVKIYRVERRAGQDWLRQDTPLVEQSCPIGESGWGMFSFTLPEGENGSYSDTIHYFRAYVVDQSWFGAESLSVGEAGSGSELPALSNTSVLLFARKNSRKGQHLPQFVGIQRSADRQKREECTRCTDKLTKAELTKMFPKLKTDKDLFALTRKRYKDKFNITLPDYTLDSFVGELNKTLEEFKINTCRRKAYFLAQLAQETGEFTDMAENISEATANDKYAGKNGNEETGDGFKYRGRGLIQLTGRGGYQRFQAFAGPGDGKDYLEEPDAMLQSLACLVRSAGWFWQHGKVLGSGAELPLNPKADMGDFKRICELVQGADTSFQERKERLEKDIRPVIFGNSYCKTEQSTTQPTIDLHIYQSGKIEKLVAADKTYLARYYYHDKNGGQHYLGSVDFHKEAWRASSSTEQKKDKDGNTFNYAELIFTA